MNSKNKSKALTREDILNAPDVPKGQRFCDFPEKDREFAKEFLEVRRLLHEAAKDLTGQEKTNYWLRALSVCKVTGLPVDSYNHLNQADEIKVLKVAAKMKKQEQKDLIIALGKILPEFLKHSKSNNSTTNLQNIMSIREFLEKRTDVDYKVIESKIKRVKAVDKQRKLLKTANNPMGNETKLYYENELEKVWPQLKIAIPTLPNIKK